MIMDRHEEIQMIRKLADVQFLCGIIILGYFPSVGKCT